MLPLEVFPGYRRWLLQDPYPSLLGVLVRVPLNDYCEFPLNEVSNLPLKCPPIPIVSPNTLSLHLPLTDPFSAYMFWLSCLVFLWDYLQWYQRLCLILLLDFWTLFLLEVALLCCKWGRGAPSLIATWCATFDWLVGGTCYFLKRNGGGSEGWWRGRA